MNITAFVKTLISMARPLTMMVGPQAQKIVERWVTVPAADRAKLHAHLSTESAAHANLLAGAIADAISDYVCFVASSGDVEPD